MLRYRAVREADLHDVVSFPQSAKELFNIFPAASYPLTIEQLKKAVDTRFESTVVLHGQEVVGFANYYSLKQAVSCVIGNLIVRPNRRRCGIGEYLTRTMVEIAFAKYSVDTVFISCFSDNFAGLLLYAKVGFVPVSVDSVKDPDGRIIPRVKFQLGRELWNQHTAPTRA